MLLLLFPTLPTGARVVNLINGRAQLGCQCFLQSLRLELGAAPLPLFTENPRRPLLGSSCIKATGQPLTLGVSSARSIDNLVPFGH